MLPLSPGLCHLPCTCASPTEKGRLPKVGFVDEHNVAEQINCSLEAGQDCALQGWSHVPIWNRWAVHTLTVIHAMVCCVLNCFPRDDWLVSSAKYFQERNSWNCFFFFFLVYINTYIYELWILWIFNTPIPKICPQMVSKSLQFLEMLQWRWS